MSSGLEFTVEVGGKSYTYAIRGEKAKDLTEEQIERVKAVAEAIIAKTEKIGLASGEKEIVQRIARKQVESLKESQPEVVISRELAELGEVKREDLSPPLLERLRHCGVAERGTYEQLWTTAQKVSRVAEDVLGTAEAAAVVQEKEMPPSVKESALNENSMERRALSPQEQTAFVKDVKESFAELSALPDGTIESFVQLQARYWQSYPGLTNKGLFQVQIKNRLQEIERKIQEEEFAIEEQKNLLTTPFFVPLSALKSKKAKKESASPPKDEPVYEGDGAAPLDEEIAIVLLRRENAINYEARLRELLEKKESEKINYKGVASHVEPLCAAFVSKDLELFNVEFALILQGLKPDLKKGFQKKFQAISTELQQEMKKPEGNLPERAALDRFFRLLLEAMGEELK